MKQSQQEPIFFRRFVPLAFVITIFFGTMYITIQQSYRQSANDPQIQMAQDLTHQLNMNQKLATNISIDIETSLSPFIMIFDVNGNIVASQAVLNGNTPHVPNGVFSYTKLRGEDRFTWQPSNKTRIAAVVEQYNNGFVLVGRNIKEIENRELQLEYFIFTGWLVSLIGSAILTAII